METNHQDYFEDKSEGQAPSQNEPGTSGQPASEHQNVYGVTPQEEEQAHHGREKKHSPYENSPYAACSAPQGNASSAAAFDSAYEQPKKKGGHRVLKGVAAAAVAVCLVAGSCGITAASVNSRWERKTSEMEAQFNNKISQLEQDQTGPSSGVSNELSAPSGLMTPSQVYQRNVSSVVAISNQGITTNVYGQTSATASSGSGFIISENGYVVSNYHVVKGAQILHVITSDGTEYPAELVGFDKANDVSLLKIEAEGLNPVTIGSSDDLIVGDQVAAIGNPLGELTSTLTVGYVSAKDRTINTDGRSEINMMQTDAAINSGNSGGPMFNMKGEVVGITTAKYSGNSGSGATIEGIGFAIPIDDVKGILSDLQEHGYVTGAYLGISVVSLDKATADLYSLPTGSRVASMVEGGCAEKAGVQVKDIIIGLGEHNVESNSDLTRALRKFKAGDTTTIRVYRGGEELELTITLDEKPAPAENEENQQPIPGNPENMPDEGNAEEWFHYFSPFFKFGN